MTNTNNSYSFVGMVVDNVTKEPVLYQTQMFNKFTLAESAEEFGRKLGKQLFDEMDKLKSEEGLTIVQ